MRALVKALFLLAFAAPAAFAQIQPAARQPSAVTHAGYMIQGIIGLMIVLGLIWGAWWIIRRTGFNRAFSGVQMKVVGGLAVGHRERVMIVEIGDQWLVLGVTAHQISTLATIPRQELSEEEQQARSLPFAAWLKKTTDRQKDAEKS